MVDAALKTAIMNQVDKQFDDQTKVLADLVKIPSTRFREAPAQDMMARLFKEDRLSVDRWQIKIDAELAAVSVWIRAHAPITFGSEFGQFWNELAILVEELLRMIAMHPLFQDL